ncbi:MAG: sigma-70 family RNA polymerase sigma factor [Lachnospiraceae bacterium]|nr:sigma-70 family RNA polymerase sigma factor [Lachnospiraceae bacterium]
MKDSELIELLLNKQQEGLDVLIKEYGSLMRYIIKPILPDYREQEECLADVAYRIWEKINTYHSGKGNFNTWISAITRNAAYNRARDNRKKDEYEEMPEDLISKDNNPEDEILKKERMQMLHNAMSELSVKDRQLIYRKYYYMQSTEQIAAELGLTERAVEGRLYRIKKRLRGKCHE